MNRDRRYWGVWTSEKLEVLEEYLAGFARATKRSDETLYLDLFAGRIDNVERDTNKALRGSPRIALSIDEHPFTRLRFFELDKRHAEKLDEVLRQEYPGRDFEVIAGDCNQEIKRVLRSLARFSWAPTFAFIDPNGPDVAWSTLKALADFKPPGKRKVELWILLADAMVFRNLPVNGSVTDAEAAKLTAMYGSAAWQAIYRARVEGRLEPAEAREEYVNLMRWRLEKLLGYRWTHPLEFRSEHGNPLYHMIFATDDQVGTKIMSHIYSSARTRFPANRQKIKSAQRRLDEERRGIQNLFGVAVDDLGVGPEIDRYQYEEPWLPYGAEDPDSGL